MSQLTKNVTTRVLHKMYYYTKGNNEGNMKFALLEWVCSRVHNEREYATPVYGAMPSVPRFDITNQWPWVMNIIIKPHHIVTSNMASLRSTPSPFYQVQSLLRQKLTTQSSLIRCTHWTWKVANLLATSTGDLHKEFAVLHSYSADTSCSMCTCPSLATYSRNSLLSAGADSGICARGVQSVAPLPKFRFLINYSWICHRTFT